MRDRISDEPARAHFFPYLINLGSAETGSGWWIRSSWQSHSSLISILDAIGFLLVERLRERVIPGAVVLGDEIQIRNVRRSGGGLERRLARAADRRGRQPGHLVRVVGRVDFEVIERKLAPVSERVLDRGIGIELH